MFLLNNSIEHPLIYKMSSLSVQVAEIGNLNTKNDILTTSRNEESFFFLLVKQLRLDNWDTQYDLLALYRYQSPYI